MTLTEVLVASFLLVFGMTAIARLVTALSAASLMSGHMTEATEIAQQKIEELLTIDYASVQSGTDQESTFVRSWTVIERGEEIKEVMVDVAWHDAMGITRDIQLRSWVAAEGSTELPSHMFTNIPSLGP